MAPSPGTLVIIPELGVGHFGFARKWILNLHDIVHQGSRYGHDMSGAVTPVDTRSDGTLGVNLGIHGVQG